MFPIERLLLDRHRNITKNDWIRLDDWIETLWLKLYGYDYDVYVYTSQYSYDVMVFIAANMNAIRLDDLQLFGLTCFWITLKMISEYDDIPLVIDLIMLSGYKINKRELIRKEKEILQQVQWILPIY